MAKRKLRGKPAKYLVEIIHLYRHRGWSGRVVADYLGIPKGSVFAALKWSGVSRTREAAGRLANPEKPSEHWRTSRTQARRKWEKEVGPIPEGYHVHHKDGDFTNNNIENLEVMSPEVHSRLHALERRNSTPRWRQPKRKEYMKRWRAKNKEKNRVYYLRRKERLQAGGRS